MRPLQRFAEVEAAGGIVMVVAAAVALGWANSAWHSAYDALWSAPVAVQAGPVRLLHTDARGLVNDVAMTLFFFVVTASIKRELLTGHLADRRRATLPVVAAVGGMVVARRCSTSSSTVATGRRTAGASPPRRTSPSRSASSR